VALWRLDQHGGGRYVLDTAKGADLGSSGRGPSHRPELPVPPVLPRRFHEAEAWKGPYPAQRRGAFRLTMFVNIAHAARCYGRDDQRALALYGYS